MKINYYNLGTLYFTIFITMIISIYFYNKIVKSFIDKILISTSIVGEFVTLFGSILKNKYITELGHCIFGLVILLISLFGTSPQILLLNIGLLSYTILSRRILNNCMFDYDIEDNIKDDISITKIYPDLPWDFIYTTLIVISSIRFLYITNYN